MLKPKITIDMLMLEDKTFYEAIRDTAKLDDFKAIFEAQAFGDFHGLRSTLAKLYKDNVEFNNKILAYANDELRYSPIIAKLVANKSYFKNIVIPSRDADFMLTDVLVGQEVYFWIEERMEITLDIKSHKPYIAKLMVDDKSDSLLFHNGEDSWVEYGNKLTRHHKGIGDTKTMADFADKVAIRYKEFLAEQQLLKD